MASPIIVTARLLSPLAGADAPHLDALLAAGVSRLTGKPDDLAGWKLQAGVDPATLPEVPIPIPRERLGRWGVARCSSPIFAADADGREHVCRRLDPAGVDVIDPAALRKINTSGGEFKSYRLPLRTRTVDVVRWFAVGKPSRVLAALRRIGHLGKKGAIGYGRVAEWTVEPAAGDYSWFAPGDDGRPVLMRPMPVGPWLPDDLAGARRDFGACAPPYWHRGSYGEIVVPC